MRHRSYKCRGAAASDRPITGRHTSLASLYVDNPIERIEVIRKGIPASVLMRITQEMAISKYKLYETIGMPRATADRKLREKQVLNRNETEGVLGIIRLIDQADTMVKESGNPEGFDAAKWVAAWLERPHPALGGRRPAELMDTAEGRCIVSDLIARIQSSAYA